MKYYSEEEINKIILHVKKYTIHKQANNIRPALSLIFTLLGYFASIVLCRYSTIGIIFVAFFSLRLFMIFHDCCHGCFFKAGAKGGLNLNIKSAQAIDQFCYIGRVHWTSSHSKHHEIHGNLSCNDVTRTVFLSAQYHSFGVYKKICYRVLRAPIMFFLLGPLYLFWFDKVIEKRFNYLFKYIFLLIFIAFSGGAFTLVNFLLGQYLAGVFGLVLFHLQHQVNPGYWQVFDKADISSYYRAQLHGSSYLRMPFFLRWVTYGIEYHHIHHLSTQVPCYLLKRCQDEGAELFYKNPRVGYWQAFRSLFHTLYDEEQGRYISFPLARWLGLQA